MTPLKVLLVDDHDVLRAGVRDFLAGLPGYRLVGEARTAAAALVMLEAEKPDIVLMDLALPGMDGITATREVLRRRPGGRVVVLTAHRQIHDVVDAINAGVSGYVLKADPPETLLQALDHAAKGAFYMAPALRPHLAAFTEASTAGGGVLGALSEREREIFRLAADCSTAREIATKLRISRKTVDVHLNNVNRKLGLRDRAQLVRLAVSIGVLHAEHSRTGERRWRTAAG